MKSDAQIIELGRLCTKCGVSKPASDFYTDLRRCKTCVRRRVNAHQQLPEVQAARKQWRADNADHVVQQRHKQQREKWRLVLLSAARARARIARLAFDLTLENVAWPDFCPILGIRLTPGVGVGCGKGNHSDTAPTIDRLIPAYGYTAENVAVISWRANRLKSDATLHELESIVRWMRQRGCR